MTAEDLDIIVAGVAPVLKEYIAAKQQELLGRIVDDEARIAQLDARIKALEART